MKAFDEAFKIVAEIRKMYYKAKYQIEFDNGAYHPNEVCINQIK